MKPKKGCSSAVMDDPVKDPLLLVKQLVLLIVEARTPDFSVKGRVEGPHCPIIRGRPAHKCSVEKAECVRAREFCYLAQKLWLNSIPICLDILMFPDCSHGYEEAAVTEGTVTKFSRENALLVERWTIDGSKRRRQDDVQSSSMLLQAVRSYLHFSQISSWLYSTSGKLPGILTYRLYAPGEGSSLDFSCSQDKHSFPLCLASFCHIRVGVSSMQRQASVPVLVCFQRQSSSGSECGAGSKYSKNAASVEASGMFGQMDASKFGQIDFGGGKFGQMDANRYGQVDATKFDQIDPCNKFGLVHCGSKFGQLDASKYGQIEPESNFGLVEFGDKFGQVDASKYDEMEICGKFGQMDFGSKIGQLEACKFGQTETGSKFGQVNASKFDYEQFLYSDRPHADRISTNRKCRHNLEMSATNYKIPAEKKANRLTKSLKEMTEDVLFDEVVRVCDLCSEDGSQQFSDFYHGDRNVSASSGVTSKKMALSESHPRNFGISRLTTKDDYQKFSAGNSQVSTDFMSEFDHDGEYNEAFHQYPSEMSVFSQNSKTSKNKSSIFQMDQTQNISSVNRAQFFDLKQQVGDESDGRKRQGPRVRKKDGEKDLRIEQMKRGLVLDMSESKVHEKRDEEGCDVERLIWKKKKEGQAHSNFGKNFCEGKPDLETGLPLWLCLRKDKLAVENQDSEGGHEFLSFLTTGHQLNNERAFNGGDVAMLNAKKSKEWRQLEKVKSRRQLRDDMEEKLIQQLSNRLSLQTTQTQEDVAAVQKGSCKFQKTECSTKKTDIYDCSIKASSEVQARKVPQEKMAGNVKENYGLCPVVTEVEMKDSFSKLSIDVSEPPTDVFNEDSDDTPVTSPDKSPPPKSTSPQLKSVSESQMNSFKSQRSQVNSCETHQVLQIKSLENQVGKQGPHFCEKDSAESFSQSLNSAVTDSMFIGNLDTRSSLSGQSLKTMSPSGVEHCQPFMQLCKDTNLDSQSHKALGSTSQHGQTFQHSQSIISDVYDEQKRKIDLPCQVGPLANKQIWFKDSNEGHQEQDQNNEKTCENSQNSAVNNIVNDQSGSGRRKIFEENLLPLVSYDADSDSFRNVEQSFSRDVIHSPKVLFSCDVSSSKPATSTKCIDFSVALESEFFKSKVNDMVGPEAIEKYMSKLAALYSLSANLFSPASVSSSSSSDADDHAEGRGDGGIRKTLHQGTSADKPAGVGGFVQQGKLANSGTTDSGAFNSRDFLDGSVDEYNSKLKDIASEIKTKEKYEDQRERRWDSNLVNGKPESDTGSFSEALKKDASQNLKERLALKNSISQIKENQNLSEGDAELAQSSKLKLGGSADLQGNSEIVEHHGHDKLYQKTKGSLDLMASGNKRSQETIISPESKKSPQSTSSACSTSTASSLKDTVFTHDTRKMNDSICSSEIKDLPRKGFFKSLPGRGSSKPESRNSSSKATGRIYSSSLSTERRAPLDKHEIDGKPISNIQSPVLIASDSSTSPEPMKSSPATISLLLTSAHHISALPLPDNNRQQGNMPAHSCSSDLHDLNDNKSPTSLSQTTMPHLIPQRPHDFSQGSELEPELKSTLTPEGQSSGDSQKVHNTQSSGSTQKILNLPQPDIQTVCKSCQDFAIPQIFPPQSKSSDSSPKFMSFSQPDNQNVCKSCQDVTIPQIFPAQSKSSDSSPKILSLPQNVCKRSQDILVPEIFPTQPKSEQLLHRQSHSHMSSVSRQSETLSDEKTNAISASKQSTALTDWETDEEFQLHGVEEIPFHDSITTSVCEDKTTVHAECKNLLHVSSIPEPIVNSYLKKTRPISVSRKLFENNGDSSDKNNGDSSDKNNGDSSAKKCDKRDSAIASSLLSSMTPVDLCTNIKSTDTKFFVGENKFNTSSNDSSMFECNGLSENKTTGNSEACPESWKRHESLIVALTDESVQEIGGVRNKGETLISFMFLSDQKSPELVSASLSTDLDYKSKRISQEKAKFVQQGGRVINEGETLKNSNKSSEHVTGASENLAKTVACNGGGAAINEGEILLNSNKSSELSAGDSGSLARALGCKSQPVSQGEARFINIGSFLSSEHVCDIPMGSELSTKEAYDADKYSKVSSEDHGSRQIYCPPSEQTQSSLSDEKFDTEGSQKSKLLQSSLSGEKFDSEGSHKSKNDDFNNDVSFYISRPKGKSKIDLSSSQLLPTDQGVTSLPDISSTSRSPVVSDDLEVQLRANPGSRAKSNLDSFGLSGSPPLHGDPPGWSSVPPHRTVSTPSGMDRRIRGQDQKQISRVSVIQKQNCDNLSQINLQRMAARSASMIFNNRTGLPTQSSPAPLNRKSGSGFDYDPSLLSTRAIKNAFSCSKLATSGADEGNDSEEDKTRTLSTSAPASTNCLLGNFEESILNGRIDPVGTVEGFTAEIGASGSFCPKHLHLPVSAFFFALSDDNAPSPYLGHINLERISKKGYHIPKKGTVQVTLFNPNKTVVKMFVVMYDLSDMPPSSRTFIRQRTIYCPTDKTCAAPSYLRYLIHLRCASSRSGKIYLHTDIRLIFARHKLDIDGKTVPFELHSYTEVPQNPKYSPKK